MAVLGGRASCKVFGSWEWSHTDWIGLMPSLRHKWILALAELDYLPRAGCYKVRLLLVFCLFYTCLLVLPTSACLEITTGPSQMLPLILDFLAARTLSPNNPPFLKNKLPSLRYSVTATENGLIHISILVQQNNSSVCCGPNVYVPLKLIL